MQFVFNPDATLCWHRHSIAEFTSHRSDNVHVDLFKGVISFQSGRFCDIGEVECPVLGHATNQLYFSDLRRCSVFLRNSVFSKCILYLIDLYFFSSCNLVLLRGPMVHDGRWRGVRSSGGRGGRPNPLTSRSPFCFVIWGGSWGGLVHWCWWTCTLYMGLERAGGRAAWAHSRQTHIRAAWQWKGLIRY